MNFPPAPPQQESIDMVLNGSYEPGSAYLDQQKGRKPSTMAAHGASLPVTPNRSIGRATTSSPRRLGAKNGAKKRSWVWDWFVQNADDANAAVCDHCQRVILRLALDKGLPKKLSEHLKTHKVTRDSVNPTRQGHVPRGNAPPRVPVGVMVPPSAEGSTFSVVDGTVTQEHNFGPVEGHDPSHEETQAEDPVQDDGNGLGPDQAPDHGQDPRLSPVVVSQLPLLERTRFYSLEFDNTQYSAVKFQKNIMRFLTENKLPIAVVKSHSFRQIIYDLRPNSIPELNDLNSLYSSLIQVLKNDKVDGEGDDGVYAPGDPSATEGNWDVLR